MGTPYRGDVTRFASRLGEATPVPWTGPTTSPALVTLPPMADQANFEQLGIPVAFLFSGLHDDYHQPSDTVDKIMFEKMEKIGRLIFYTTWELANREARIRVNVKED